MTLRLNHILQGNKHLGVVISHDGTDPFAPRGPVIGSYMGQPIHDFITSEGRRLLFNRIAVESKEGYIDIAQLGEHEALLAPGLIFRLDSPVSK